MNIFTSEGFNPSQCPDPVFDEAFSGRPIDPDLLDAIDDLAAQGVDARVLIVQSFDEEVGLDYGNVPDNDQFYRLGDDTSDEAFDVCGVDQYSGVLLVDVRDDGYVNVLVSGDQQDFKDRNPSLFKGIVDAYDDSVYEGGIDTQQDDAAHALNSLHDAQFGSNEAEDAEVQGARDTAEHTSPQVEVPSGREPIDINFPDVPVVPILSTLALAGAVLSAGSVARNRFSVRARHRSFNGRLDADKTRARDAFLGVETMLRSHELVESAGDRNPAQVDDTVRVDPLSIVHSDDIPELVAIQARIESGYDEWSRLQDRFQERGNNAARGLRVRTEDMDALERRYTGVTQEYLGLVDQLEAGIDEVQQRRAEAPKTLNAFEKKLLAVEGLENKLTRMPAEGETDYTQYAMPALSERIGGIRQQLVSARKRYHSGYINSPVQTSTEGIVELEGILETLKNVPLMHEQLIADVVNTRSELSARRAQQAELVEFERELSENYHENCAGNVSNLVSASSDHIDTLGTASEELGDPTDTYELGQLMSMQAKLTQMKETIDLFDASATDAFGHRDTLATLVEGAPGRIDEIDILLDEAERFIDENSDDVDDETEAEILALDEVVNTLDGQLEQDMPDYFALDAEITALSQLSSDKYSQAKSERDEMIELRTYVTDAPTKHAAELQELKKFEQQNPSVDSATEADIEQLEELESSDSLTRQSRQQLRRSKESLEDALEDVRGIAKDARGDVKRERDRVAAIRKAEAQKRAAAAQKAKDARDAKLRAERKRERAKQAREDEKRAARRTRATRSSSSPSRSSSSRRSSPSRSSSSRRSSPSRSSSSRRRR